MTNKYTRIAILLSVGGLFLAGIFLLMPIKTEAMSRFGGSHALSRAAVGITHANSSSQIFSRLFSVEQGNNEDEEENNDDESTDDTDTQNNSSGNGAGNGGHGGNAAAGGLIIARNAVSNSMALNMINVTIVRIGSWD